MITREKIIELSKQKNEPAWILDFRLSALDIFYAKEIPFFGPDLSDLDLDKIVYYLRPGEKLNSKSWEEVPEEIKQTFIKLGIPEAEQKALAGIGAQYESEVVYHNLKQEFLELGVIYEDLSVAINLYPDLVKKYFGKCLSPELHKFMALHYAVWSGGTFLLVPSGVKLDRPVQSYFRMASPGMGQFEHTLIIIEDSAEAHYIEGCSAPRFDISALHAGGVEIFVGRNARFRYSSVENWSRDVYNLNTKRAIIEKNATIEWVTGNLGSKKSMVYPCSILKGENSRADHLSIAVAENGQFQDIGAKVIHLAPKTSSRIISKSISKLGGIVNYRGLVYVSPKATSAKVSINCDGLILDKNSFSYTYPTNIIENPSSSCIQETTVGRLSADKIFYLQSRGLSEKEAESLLINGFIEPVMKEIPLEYAIEMNRMLN